MRGLDLDIETAYTIGAVWGMYEQNLAEVIQDEYILGIGYRHVGEKKAYWKGLPDFPLYAKDKKNDLELVKFIATLLDEADFITAHNGRTFDMKKIRARMLVHHLPPLNEPRIIDTKVEYKKCASFISNKLDDLSRQLFGERKLKHSGISLWTRCMADTYDKDAWKEMATYCKKDVMLLKPMRELIWPWMRNPPNWNLDGDRPKCCPSCGSAQFMRAGNDATMSSVRQKYRCSRKECRHIWRGEVIKRITTTHWADPYSTK